MSHKRPAHRSPLPMVLAITAAFVFGAGVAGYGVWQFTEHGGSLAKGDAGAAVLPVAGMVGPSAPEPQATATGVLAARAAAQVAERVAVQQGGLDQRLAAAEQRIARLDLQAQAASGNAARAEGLLIAFSARRALDRGRTLGFLADQLRLRFGDALPNAVQTIIAFGNRPVTLDELIARLDGLAPELSETHGRLSWGTVRQELGQLFVVRRESTPSPQPQRRLERARLFLQSGRVEAAIAEVRNLPGAENAGDWIASAERYAAAQAAIDLVETAAVMEPRRLRDGEGHAVQQPSPVIAPPMPVTAGGAPASGSWPASGAQ